MSGGAFILGLLIGAVVVWYWQRGRSTPMGPPAPETSSADGLEAHRIQQAEAKAEAREKIVAYLEAHNEITNEKVEELTGVSDATATRYLQELENEGRITQIGTVGRNVQYRKR